MVLDIVTVHRNDFAGLRRTLGSLTASLANEDFRWYVVDGESDQRHPDDAQLLARVAAEAAGFVSEPDDGIYDAMNKGASMGEGDYVLFLNAGDVLHPAFDWERLAQELPADRPAMVWGTCHERFPDGSLVRVRNRSPALAWYGMPVNHQNVLFQRIDMSEQPYDKNLRICADYELVSRLLQRGGKAYRTSMPIAIFERGGTGARNFEITLEEEEMLRTRYYGVPPWLSRLISHLKALTARVGRQPSMRRILRRWV